MSGDAERVLSVSIPEDLAGWLQAEANRQGLNVHDLIVEVLQSHRFWNKKT